MTMKAQPEWHTLLEVIDLLQDSGINYMLTGSLANAFYLHNQFHVKVDLVVRKDDEFRRTEFNRRKPFRLQDRTAWVVSPEDLIISKLHWAKDSHSEMQLRDVKDLLQSVKDLDIAYVEKWITELGLKPLYSKVKL